MSWAKRREFQFDHNFDCFLAAHWRDARFLSITFRENVTDKAVAEAAWRPVREWFNRRGIRYLGVWEEQRRGAWHLHLVLSCYVDITKFRAFAMSVGWGPIMKIKRVLVEVDDFHAPEPAQVESSIAKLKRYLGKYLQKGHRGGGNRYCKLTVYGKGDRKCSMTFAWAFENGARLWRLGCDLFTGLQHIQGLSARAPRWDEYDFVIKLAFEHAWGLPGWENLMWSRYEIEYG